MNSRHPTDDSSATVQGHTSESTTVNIEPMNEDQPPKYTPPTTGYAPPPGPPPPLTPEQPRPSPSNVPPPPKKHFQNNYGTSNGNSTAGRGSERSPLLDRPPTVWTNMRNNIGSVDSFRGRFRAWMHQNPCCICLSMIGLVVALLITFLVMCDCFGGDCVIPEDAEVITMNQKIDPSLYSELVFRLGRGISGDISVFQSRDINSDQIEIFMSMKASTPDMLSLMAKSLQLTPQRGRAESSLFMNMTEPVLKKALQRNCTRVDVDIVFPRNLTVYRGIDIQSSFRGNVWIKMDDVYLTDKMAIKTTRGDVQIEDAIVEKELNVRSGGLIQADVKVKSLVDLEANGRINLELASKSPTLYVKAKSLSSKVIVFLTRTFNGHFSLKTTSEIPIVTGPCCIYPTRWDNYTLQGYVSKWDEEPGYLPRVELKGRDARLNLVF